MRLLKLDVSSFKAISEASVTFGPGLNVLYGPNDLGKSTLVSAIRAALLTPASSTAGNDFISWYSDKTPRVVLELEGEKGLQWRVTKEFGRHQLAELRTSKDGVSWSVAAKGREVDERLRALLEWGLPEFKGKPGSKRLVDSFLSSALLGAQTDVDELLGHSLAEDGSDSGRRALTRALSVLAQDPLFKRVLDTVDLELSKYLSTTGKKLRRADSPFKKAGDTVKRLSDELDEAQRALNEAKAGEERLALLSAASQKRRAEEAQASARVAQLEGAMEQAARRASLEQEAQRAREALEAIEAHHRRAEVLEREALELEQALPEYERAKDSADAQLHSAREAVSKAERALESAQQGEAERLVELERARRAEQVASLEAQVTKLRAERDHLEREAGAFAERGRLERARTELSSRLAALREEHGALAARRASALQALELAEAIVAYGEWAEAEQSSHRAQANLAEASALTSRAAELEAEVARATEAIAAQVAALEAARLPDAKTVAALRDLHLKKVEADALIGGGVSVVVRAREPLRLHVEADEEPAVDEPRLLGERRLDAERRVALSIGQMVEIEISAGKKEQRAMADMLSRRWKKEALPVLTEAGVTTVSELELRRAEYEAAATALQRRHAEVLQRSKEAEQLRAQAALLGRQEAQPGPEERSRRRARIPPSQLAVLEVMFPSLGPDWRRDTATQQDAARRALQEAERALVALEKELALAEAGESSLAQSLATLRAPVNDPIATLAAAVKAAQEHESRLDAARVELAATQARRGTLATAAEAELASARRAVEAAVARAQAATATLEERRGAATAARARAAQQAEVTSSQDRESAARRVRAAEAALIELGAASTVTPAQVDAARQLVAQARREAEQAFAAMAAEAGALGRIGGPAVQEHHARLAEALQVARQHEQELELDAQALQLLRQTLREAEDAQTAHLGAALAPSVERQFSELTGGRYSGLALSADMQAAALGVSEASVDTAEVLSALSVGTKDQLATLVRLALARVLQTTVVLDDHLVHSDTSRLGWFLEVLKKTAVDAQVLVFTCRARDYLVESPAVSGGLVRAVDLVSVVTPWPARVGRRAGADAGRGAP